MNAAGHEKSFGGAASDYSNGLAGYHHLELLWTAVAPYSCQLIEIVTFATATSLADPSSSAVIPSSSSEFAAAKGYSGPQNSSANPKPMPAVIS